jgi:phage-related minor tail protein
MITKLTDLIREINQGETVKVVAKLVEALQHASVASANIKAAADSVDNAVANAAVEINDLRVELLKLTTDPVNKDGIERVLTLLEKAFGEKGEIKGQVQRLREELGNFGEVAE